MAGDVIAGRYRLIEPLGRGAMSAVWLAHDEELDRNVAVKTLAPTADRARFEREARAVAALSHPNICSVYDYGESDGKPFMVLECLPNGSLEERLAGGKSLPDDEAQVIAAEIAAALAHAHERGLVHRDLKPANVLFDTEGRAKIADFGIARMGGAGTLTEAGTVLGTASYISPEQASGQPAGPPSDVYSFGVILFRMLTGALPFVSTNAMELVRMHRDDPPPAVSDLRTDAPPGLAAVANASLAKDPAARPADGAALVAALNGGGVAAGGVAAARTETAAATQVIPPTTRRRRRLPVLPLVLLALVLLGGGVALALSVTGRDDSPTAPAPSLDLPSVATIGSTSSVESTAPAATVPTHTTAPTTTAHTTTAHTTTARTTTRRTTTAPTLPTLPTTTAPLPPPTTTALPPTTTTTSTTTIALTTETTPTTTVGATTTTP